MNIKVAPPHTSKRILLRDAQDLRRWRESLGREPAAREDSSLSTQPLIALVPTMGYLHEGHLSLIRQARTLAQHVVVSLFVNPTQFNDPQDFEHYPRDEEGDLKAAFSAGADAVFLPTPEVIYPQGSQTRVRVGLLAKFLCGATRPGHFEGVCTVVMALFQLTQCQVAIFGEKDYQQLSIIRQMTRDLHLPIEIIGAPTLREDDGLAMSSRNARLTLSERQSASSIYQGLLAAQAVWAEGTREVDILRAIIRKHLPPKARIDYLEVCHPHTLEPLQGHLNVYDSAVVAIACFLGKVRLIDNIVLED